MSVDQPVRLYGSFMGYSSASMVTRGWQEALTEWGLLAGTFSFRKDTDMPGGHLAPVALVADVRELPAAIAMEHEHIFVVLAMHSPWLPDEMIAIFRQRPLTILATSGDTKRHFTSVVPDIPCDVVPHGVDRAFKPFTAEEKNQLAGSGLAKDLAGKGIKLLHLCESSAERKGTYCLLQAFEKALEHCDLSLTVITSSMQLPRVSAFVQQMASQDAAKRVRVISRINAPPFNMRWVYGCSDAIVAPSRAEGFGMVPLEALCCGVPCAITLSNGHAEWCYVRRDDKLSGLRPGIMGLETGAPGFPSFEPGPAPVLDPVILAQQLCIFASMYEDLREEARQNAPSYRPSWDWKNACGEWCQFIKEEFS